VRQTGRSPSELLQDLYEMVGPHYYDRADVELDPGDSSRLRQTLEDLGPKEVGGVKVDRIDRTDGVRLVLGDGSWILYRLSGTEPLLRVYVETDSEERVGNLIDAGAALLGIAL